MMKEEMIPQCDVFLEINQQRYKQIINTMEFRANSLEICQMKIGNKLQIFRQSTEHEKALEYHGLKGLRSSALGFLSDSIREKIMEFLAVYKSRGSPIKTLTDNNASIKEKALIVINQLRDLNERKEQLISKRDQYLNMHNSCLQKIREIKK